MFFMLLNTIYTDINSSQWSTHKSLCRRDVIPYLHQFSLNAYKQHKSYFNLGLNDLTYFACQKHVPYSTNPFKTFAFQTGTARASLDDEISFLKKLYLSNCAQCVAS